MGQSLRPWGWPAKCAHKIDQGRPLVVVNDSLFAHVKPCDVSEAETDFWFHDGGFWVGLDPGVFRTHHICALPQSGCLLVWKAVSANAAHCFVGNRARCSVTKRARIWVDHHCGWTSSRNVNCETRITSLSNFATRFLVIDVAFASFAHAFIVGHVVNNLVIGPSELHVLETRCLFTVVIKVVTG